MVSTATDSCDQEGSTNEWPQRIGNWTRVGQELVAYARSTDGRMYERVSEKEAVSTSETGRQSGRRSDPGVLILARR